MELALGRRVRRKVKRRAARQKGGGVGEGGVADAGLNVGDAIFQVDRQDAVHLGDRDDHAQVERDASAGETRAAAARDDLRVVLRDGLHHLRNLGGVDRKANGRGPRLAMVNPSAS